MPDWLILLIILYCAAFFIGSTLVIIFDKIDSTGKLYTTFFWLDDDAKDYDKKTALMVTMIPGINILHLFCICLCTVFSFILGIGWCFCKLISLISNGLCKL